MPECSTIVIIGGTGHFGGRICRRLLVQPNTELVVTSRTESKAAGLVTELIAQCPGAPVRAARLDHHSTGFETDLANLKPDIVLHTAGPFQGQDYRVAKACLNCGSHYIDLADGREFAAGFSRLNDEARRNDLLLVCGASTLPGLSSAVIDALRHKFRELHCIEMSIAPAHQTPRGRGTIAAVLSYCGKPFNVLEKGRWSGRYGWQDLRLQYYPNLGHRLSGACDVPDLVLLPQYVETSTTVTFHAALEAPWEQIALWSMAWLTRLRVVKDWGRLIPAFAWMSDRLIKLGSQSGGMHIRLTGIDVDGQEKTCVWYLTARQNHGPEIPCAPALVLARKLVMGTISRRGAFACLGLIELSEFEQEVADLDISSELVE